MENIFKNAYFGKAYKTRDGRKVLYQRNFLSKYIDPSDGREYYISLHTVMSEQYIWQVDDEGKREDLRRMSSNLDIVSEWSEEINEQEKKQLDELLADQNYPYPLYDKSDMCVAHSNDGSTKV